MRVVIQRVKSGSVSVDGSVVSQIGKGIVCLVGIVDSDTLADAQWLVTRTLGCKLWDNDDGRPWRKSVVNLGYDVLIVSQFTLSCEKLGAKHVPDFRRSMPPAAAHVLYNDVLRLAREGHKGGKVEAGVFGANMDVALTNDGPVTIIVDTPPPKPAPPLPPAAGAAAEEAAAAPTPEKSGGTAAAETAVMAALSAEDLGSDVDGGGDLRGL